jgi:hypothetical protein
MRGRQWFLSAAIEGRMVRQAAAVRGGLGQKNDARGD